MPFIQVTLHDWDSEKDEPRPTLKARIDFEDAQILDAVNQKAVTVSVGSESVSGTLQLPLAQIMELLAVVIRQDIDRDSSPIILPKGFKLQ